MGIQLRGLPKAYTTVYVDGVKKSDATTPKNDFYFDDILTGQVSRVEILKGNQSSMYGSGAMGGAINIFSKQIILYHLHTKLFLLESLDLDTYYLHQLLHYNRLYLVSDEDIIQTRV